MLKKIKEQAILFLKTYVYFVLVWVVIPCAIMSIVSLFSR